MAIGQLALYGRVKVVKGYCETCNGWAFIVGGRIQCCDEKYIVSTFAIVRCSKVPPELHKRRHLSRQDKARKLDEQNHRCFYCGQHFYVIFRLGNKLEKLRVTWDHVLPFSTVDQLFEFIEDEENIVAACQFCNAWKGAKTGTIKEIRAYVNQKWKEKVRNIYL